MAICFTFKSSAGGHANGSCLCIGKSRFFMTAKGFALTLSDKTKFLQFSIHGVAMPSEALAQSTFNMSQCAVVEARDKTLSGV